MEAKISIVDRRASQGSARDAPFLKQRNHFHPPLCPTFTGMKVDWEIGELTAARQSSAGSQKQTLKNQRGKTKRPSSSRGRPFGLYTEKGKEQTG